VIDIGTAGTKRRTKDGAHVYSAAGAVDWNERWPKTPPPLAEVYGEEVAKLVANKPEVPHAEQAWEHWRKLGSPRFHVAPMVDQSELAFRMLCRKYGCDSAYTPMIHSRLFVEDKNYQDEIFETTGDGADRPLWIQFCANDPELFVTAARKIQQHGDYIDLNLGCPQRIARRGNYGAFLMDDIPAACAVVRKGATELDTPMSVKIRVFDDVARTIDYARQLEAAGAMLLCVHGRTREQKAIGSFPADWDQIRAVREALSIPVLANGNVDSYEAALQCMDYTGCEGVLSAEQLLEDPKLFWRREGDPSTKRVAAEAPRMLREYLELLREYPQPIRMVKAHIFKLLGAWLQEHFDLMAVVTQRGLAPLDELIDMTHELERRIVACGREYPIPAVNHDALEKRKQKAARKRAMYEQRREARLEAGDKLKRKAEQDEDDAGEEQGMVGGHKDKVQHV